MFKLVMPVVFSSAAIIIADGLASKVLAKCNATNEGIYGSIASKIDDSKIADIRQLKCGDVIAINQSSPDSLLLTSGRKRGKYTICLSDDESDPCKYVVGIFNDNSRVR